MYKIFRADKDAYITDKVVKSVRKSNSNVGSAGTLDLFKLYGASMSGSTPNRELSRLLIHFDTTKLKDLYDNGSIDIDHESFWCKLSLSDVYGGQPTPRDFSVSVFPLSASFIEGLGRDNSYFSDIDACNWISSSFNTAWFVSGCNKDVSDTTPGDYITSSVNLASTESSQLFVAGDEDLLVDVTKIISATLTGELPDSGFRISFNKSLEDNEQTYFVKRFASRSAYDETKHPKLIVGFDDSIRDDTQNLVFDESCRLTLYNSVGSNLSNLTSGSSQTHVTGSNCVILKLITEVSGGYYELQFSGSQYSYNDTDKAYVTGTYRADVTLSSHDPMLSASLQLSGSVSFIPVWTSTDLNVSFLSGSSIKFYPPRRSTSRTLSKYDVSVLGVSEEYRQGEEAFIRVNIFDRTSPFIKVVKVPVELPGSVVKNAYYQIRDAVTDELVVPFDLTKNSTKISNDSIGMYFNLDTGSLTAGRTYVVDVMTAINGIRTTYNNVSAQFRVVK